MRKPFFVFAKAKEKFVGMEKIKPVELRDRLNNLINLIEVSCLAHESLVEKGKSIAVLYDFVVPELQRIEQDLRGLS